MLYMQYGEQRDSPNWFWKLSSSHATYLTKTKGLFFFSFFLFFFFFWQNTENRKVKHWCVLLILWITGLHQGTYLWQSTFSFVFIRGQASCIVDWHISWLDISGHFLQQTGSVDLPNCAEANVQRNRDRLLVTIDPRSCHDAWPFHRTGSEYDGKPWIPTQQQLPLRKLSVSRQSKASLDGLSICWFRLTKVSRGKGCQSRKEEAVSQDGFRENTLRCFDRLHFLPRHGVESPWNGIWVCRNSRPWPHSTSSRCWCIWCRDRQTAGCASDSRFQSRAISREQSQADLDESEGEPSCTHG